jgi:3-hydroxyisobutyrate dehydrogenase-like beta-hydroxyacid dehydrogenase
MESTIALIGFGEAGSTFEAAGWEAGAHGRLTGNPTRLRGDGRCGQYVACATAECALSDADIVLCLVTADSTLPVAAATGCQTAGYRAGCGVVRHEQLLRRDTKQARPRR